MINFKENEDMVVFTVKRTDTYRLPAPYSSKCVEEDMYPQGNARNCITMCAANNITHELGCVPPWVRAYWPKYKGDIEVCTTGKQLLDASQQPVLFSQVIDRAG